MNKKEKYERVSIELVYLEPRDVIATSALGGDEITSWDKNGWT